MMVKVRTTDGGREEAKRMADIFRGKIVDVTKSSYVIEITGTSDKLDAFIAGVDEKNIIEVVRSGTTGISRGDKGLHL